MAKDYFATGQFGAHRFRVGQRVRPSAVGVARKLFQKHKIRQSGIVQKVDEFNSPTVLWDGRKTHKGYHGSFIEPDRRRRPPAGEG